MLLMRDSIPFTRSTAKGRLTGAVRTWHGWWVTGETADVLQVLGDVVIEARWDRDLALACPGSDGAVRVGGRPR